VAAQDILDRQLLAAKETSYYVVDTYNHRVMEWGHCATKGTVKAGHCKMVEGGKKQYCGPGAKLTHLNYPVDIAIDSHNNNSLVIVDRGNHRVVDWAQGASEGTIIVGNDKGKSGDSLHDLKNPSGVTIDSHGHIIVADTGNHRILSCQRGHKDCTVVVSGDKNKMGCGGYDVYSPEDVEVNSHGHYIITDKKYDRVVECSVNASNGGSHGHIIAGGKKDGVKCKKNCYGSSLSELYYPEGTAIDEHGNYIVADAYNNRIMKWTSSSTQGEMKAGKVDDYGSKLTQLHFPRGVVVDQGSYVIADSLNHRILRWYPGSNNGTLVAGGHGFGSKDTQLHLPDAVAVLQHSTNAQACTHASTSSPMSVAVSAAVLVCTVVLMSVS
jgi:sugar lactone lactonase YvrE